MRHQFTREECQKGRKKQGKHPEFSEIQSRKFELLKATRPDCWRWVYKHRVKPYMEGKKNA